MWFFQDFFSIIFAEYVRDFGNMFAEIQFFEFLMGIYKFMLAYVLFYEEFDPYPTLALLYPATPNF